MRHNQLAALIVVLISLAVTTKAWSQDPTRFAKQVETYQDQEPERGSERPIVFVGSSSIRMWKSLAEDFPNHYVLNRGFGGSVMSDLFYYRKELVQSLNPIQIFIYEGDNDLASGKSVHDILDTTKLLITKLREHIPDLEIVLISAKPSLARFALRKKFTELNEAFTALAAKEKYIRFVDIWTPMLGENKLVRSELFIHDGLHMNEKGYQIWKEVIAPFLLVN